MHLTRVLSGVLCNISVCQLLLGFPTDALLFLISSKQHISQNMLVLCLAPWSLSIKVGGPYPPLTLLSIALAVVSADWSGITNLSTQFVN